MTFTNLKLQVANDIGYIDSAGAILTGKDITEIDIGNWINNRYLYDLFPALSAQYPEDYIMDSVSANYSRNAGVTTNVGAVLVIDDALFISGDVGNYVYNSDTEASSLIIGYTNTSTVTLSGTLGWTVGDDIIILEREFSLGGDATDANVVPRVEVKYSTNGSYVNCKQGDYNDLSEDWNEGYGSTSSGFYSPGYGSTSPRFYLTANKDADGVVTSAIGVFPVIRVPLADAMRIKYVEVPAAMSANGDKPRLPYGFQKLLIIGAAADAYKRLGMIAEARAYEGDYQGLKQLEISTYPLTRASGPVKVKAARDLSRFFTRNR